MTGFEETDRQLRVAMQIFAVRHEAVSRSCLHGNGGDHLCHQMKLWVWIKSDPDNVTKRHKKARGIKREW